MKVTTPTPQVNVTHQIPAQPPICVQTVYVARDDDEEKKEKRCDCKKKKKDHDNKLDEDHEPDHDHEERISSARRRAYYRLQQIRRRQILRNLARALEPDSFDPGQFDPSDSFDPAFSGGGPSGGGVFDSRGFPCNQCPSRGGPRIVFVDRSQ